MVGAPPESGQTTYFPAPIIPVSLHLRNADRTPRYANGRRLYSDATQYVRPVLKSPIFGKFRNSSSESPMQFTDAGLRAAFGDHAEDGWHNILRPSVKTPRVMTLLAGTYQFALNPDGSCCDYVLIDYDVFSNALFPSAYPVDNTTLIGAAELAGDMTTHDITTFLFPNVL